MEMQLVAFAALALTVVLAGAQQPSNERERKAESPKAKFIKKCFRDQVPESCVAPPDARAKK